MNSKTSYELKKAQERMDYYARLNAEKSFQDHLNAAGAQINQGTARFRSLFHEHITGDDSKRMQAELDRLTAQLDEQGVDVYHKIKNMDIVINHMVKMAQLGAEYYSSNPGQIPSEAWKSFTGALGSIISSFKQLVDHIDITKEPASKRRFEDTVRKGEQTHNRCAKRASNKKK